MIGGDEIGESAYSQSKIGEEGSIREAERGEGAEVVTLGGAFTRAYTKSSMASRKEFETSSKRENE